MPNNEVELLAPAGKWSVLENVVQAGADAVYAGGKRFNMRMLKAGFNFSDQELKDAADYLHQQDKKLYITVNNLYYDDEINELKDYLLFLQDIGVDALIVQDAGVIHIHNELGLNIPLHASVQMGVANSETVKFLEDKGFTRVILSKNVSLEEIKDIHHKSSLSIEYFAHGDLCISHAGQCYMSSFIAGESGNRGRCVKPCRWKYSLQGINGGSMDTPSYLLAHNDLCLYPYLSELIDAGVFSFKIEGRMRSAEYLAYLITIYRKALDKIIENPSGYKMDENEYRELYDHRVRDFTAGNLFSRPGIDSIGITGEREPNFPTSVYKLSPLQTKDYDEEKEPPVADGKLKELSVKIGNLESFKQLCNSGVDNIIIGCEKIRQIKNGWNNKTIAEALQIAEDSSVNIYLETPRIVSQNDLSVVDECINVQNRDRLNGFIVNDAGILNMVKKTGLSVWAGYGLNIDNVRAAEFYYANGISRITASQELDYSKLKSILASGIEVETMVHGPICGMISDYCTARAVVNCEKKNCSVYCRSKDYGLKDEYGQTYQIRTDKECRNHIFYPHDLCLFACIPGLVSAGLKYIRIDGQYYDNVILMKLVKIYRDAMYDLQQGQWNQKDNFNRLLDMFPRGLTSVPLVR